MIDLNKNPIFADRIELNYPMLSVCYFKQTSGKTSDKAPQGIDPVSLK